MHPRLFKILGFSFVLLLLFITSSNAQDTPDDKQIVVSLRMIGHQILLKSKDSTSRVLPILKENGSYRIRFENEFQFNPEELVSTIDSIVNETGLANSYIVEMDDCATKEVIYSFMVDEITKSDIIPCKERIQPKSCYSLLFTLIKPNKPVPDTSQSNYLWVVAAVLFMLIASVLFFLWKRRKTPKNDPNLISLGAYHFDKRNTELIIEHQKIVLTSKEADLLLLLYNAANKTVEREVILNMVWGDEGDYVGRTLDVFISKLRKKLEFDSKVKIVNIRGVGYKLVMDI
ncbi:winged helix-turn-helix domain-containing protein [Sediminicola luteus]|uniref:Winged helix-turn-helix domain-containing protein n=1 Tax=Sediminicola luteus TaxID=319238 RepID=A0ABV2TX16_9FLAO